MPLTLTAMQIAVRLTLSAIAGLAIGFNRGEQGRPAGMRTTMLVCLAASIAMIQANLFINTNGRPPDSFVSFDVMRLPLGILSGIGFIGAGAILRRDNIVVGLTTAATLWYVTVMGLCIGGGQFGLGIAALVLGLGVLWGLKYVDQLIRRDIESVVAMLIDTGGPDDDEIRRAINADGCGIVEWGVVYIDGGQRREIFCGVQRRIRRDDTQPPPFVRRLSHQPGVSRLRWQPQGIQFSPPPSPPGTKTPGNSPSPDS
jgi:putative Mg2+ transporter-C (MgtC) family protein